MEAERKAPSAPTRGIQATATPLQAEEGECQIRRQDSKLDLSNYSGDGSEGSVTH